MIDFDLIVVPFRRPYGLQINTIADAFRRLGKKLAARSKEADAIERSSRRFPVIGFYNGAVMMWIDPIQYDALAPDKEPPSFADQVTSGGRKLVAGLGYVVQATEDALIIPRFLDTALDALGAVMASLARFKEPFPEMFNIQERTASDLFGEASLGFTSLVKSAPALKGFLGTVERLRGPKLAVEPILDRDRLPGMLEDFTREIVAALLLLPVLPEFVAAMWKDASIFIRAETIRRFAQIEQQMFAFRHTILDAFYVHLAGSVHGALTFVLAAEQILTGVVSYYVELAALCVGVWILDLKQWFVELARWIDRLRSTLASLIGILDELTRIDLMPFLLANAGKLLSVLPTGKVASLIADPPTFFIGDLAESSTRAAAYARLSAWLDKIQGRVAKTATGAGAAAGGKIGSYFGPWGAAIGALVGGIGAGLGVNAALKSALKGIREVLKEALLAPVNSLTVDETGAFAGPLPSFPNVADTITAGLTSARISLFDYKDKIAADLTDIAKGATTFLDDLAARAEKAAARAAGGGSLSRYLAISDIAGRLADLAFGDDARALRERTRRSDVLVSTFEQWLAPGGIQVIAEIIPRYIATMQVEWEADILRGRDQMVKLPEELPTSPHILALKPRLGKVLVRELKIRVPNRALDEKLEVDVAAAFNTGVVEAYWLGREKLASMSDVKG